LYSPMNLISDASGKRSEAKDGAIMKRETKVRSRWISFAVFLLLTGAFAQANAQTPASQQSQTDPAQVRANQANQVPDLAQLNLTPEQIQKIRGINAELKDQRQAATQRLRLAQRALAEAIESPTPDEKLIEQRSHEVADAQAATIRLRSLTEARVLQVLTPEQRIRLREMRQRNQAARRDGNQQGPRNTLGRRQDGLQRNTNSPPPGPRQRKLMRQQQPKP
jgi:Spy/CpxP family protein refolding chaperone